MKKILKRSDFKRVLMFSREKKKKIYKSLTGNCNLIKVIRWNADSHAFKRALGSVQLTRRCIITGRNNILISYYRISRLTLLKFCRDGLIANMTKSVW